MRLWALGPGPWTKEQASGPGGKAVVRIQNSAKSFPLGPIFSILFISTASGFGQNRSQTLGIRSEVRIRNPAKEFALSSRFRFLDSVIFVFSSKSYLLRL